MATPPDPLHSLWQYKCVTSDMWWPRVPGGHTHARVPGGRGARVIGEVDDAEQGVWGHMKHEQLAASGIVIGISKCDYFPIVYRLYPV